MLVVAHSAAMRTMEPNLGSYELAKLTKLPGGKAGQVRHVGAPRHGSTDQRGDTGVIDYLNQRLRHALTSIARY
jgi:hypothetical protein